MIQVLYGDVLLLIDFCIDFFVLYTTALFLRRNVKTVCIVLASLVGSVYSVAEVFINGNDILDLIISISVGILMCYITFGGYKFLKSVLVFYGIAAIVGGTMLSVYSLLGSYHLDMFGNMRGYAYSHIPLWLFGVIALVSFFIAFVFSYIGRERSEKREESVLIIRNGRSEKLKLLLDTGNLAKEPISGKYVIIVNANKIKNLLSNDEYNFVFKNDYEELLKRNFRIVAFAGVDGKQNTHIAFRPDKILVGEGKKACIVDAYIAICDNDIQFNKYDGIANPAIIA